MPLSLITASDDQSIIDLYQTQQNGRRSFGRRSWGYEVFRQNKRIFMGHFHPETWEVDPNNQYDYSADEVVLAESAHFRFLARHTEIEASILQKNGNRL